MNFFSSRCFLFFKMLKKNLLVSFLESEYFFNVIMGLAYFQVWLLHYKSCHVLPLFPIIIVFVRNLSNSSIITIILKVVLYRRLLLIIQVIILSKIFPIMIWYLPLKQLVFVVTIFWPMDDTLQLIGGLVPIILTESSSKDYCFPC